MISFSPIYDTLSKITGIAKGLLDAHVQVQINDVAIELQGAIIDLQSEVSGVQAEYQEALRAKEEAEKKLVYIGHGRERAQSMSVYRPRLVQSTDANWQEKGRTHEQSVSVVRQRSELCSGCNFSYSRWATRFDTRTKPRWGNALRIWPWRDAKLQRQSMTRHFTPALRTGGEP